MIYDLEVHSTQGCCNITTGPFSIFRLQVTPPQGTVDASDVVEPAFFQERNDAPCHSELPMETIDQTVPKDMSSDENRPQCKRSALGQREYVPVPRASCGRIQSTRLITTHSTSRWEYWPHKLMSHYITQLADLFQPIHHPRNPFFTIYVQTAMSGLFAAPELSDELDITHGPLKGNMSIFHSLVATSAFHLRGFKTTEHQEWETLDRIGRINRFKALKYLQEAIKETLIQTETPHVIVAAILCHVTMDVSLI